MLFHLFGSISIDGKIVFDADQGINLPPNKRDVGFLFQNYALWPNMTVYQNISFGLTNIKEEMDEIDFDARAAARMIEILQKPGRLTPEEFSIIKLHPQASWQLLMESHGEIIAEIALQHHERMDGSGYPRGLHADAIRMDARIIAVADVFDAITSKRSYNNPVSYEQALSIMEQERQLYDSDVLHALHILVREKRLSISI